MNYKRRKPAFRKIRRTYGYNGCGKDKIKQQICRDYFDKAFDSVKEYHFNKKYL